MMLSAREVSTGEAWEAAQSSEAQILDLRTQVERCRYGWPPGTRGVSLLRHIALAAGPPGAIYLCQYAHRSKLTLWRGAAEIADGWKGWKAASLPVERDDRHPEP